MKALLVALGFTSVGFGVAGFFIPIWPSTVFFIIALALFTRSSPKAEAWLINHPRIGPALVDWRDGGRIARRAKWTAVIAIIFSFSVSIALVGHLWVRVLLSLLMLALIAFLVTRPEPNRDQGDQKTARSA